MPDVLVIFSKTGGETGNLDLWIPLVATVIGGLISLGTTYVLKFVDDRRVANLQDFTMYILINELIHDVYSFASKYHRQLGNKDWPLNPSRAVKATLSKHITVKEVPTGLLGVFASKSSHGLTQATLELKNFRNTLVELNQHFSESVITLSKTALPHSQTISSRVSLESPS